MRQVILQNAVGPPVRRMNLSNGGLGPTLRIMKGYGQFCPVAKTAEIFAQRWTPLVIRELCFGPRRFNEVHSGVPLMSRALLVLRLSEENDKLAAQAARLLDIEAASMQEQEMQPA